MEDTTLESIYNLYNERNWREIIQKYHNHKNRASILWVFPSEENLNFLKVNLIDSKCESIISIGCGSGLLEWIVEESTGFPVHCIEIDVAWWTSKYAPKPFKKQHYARTDLSTDTKTIELLKSNAESAILFCYFNNGPAFANYLKYFRGNVLVIIGPKDGSGIQTNPKPFLNEFMDWRLKCFQQVRNSVDFIAFYTK